jgi:hypothetical protein
MAHIGEEMIKEFPSSWICECENRKAHSGNFLWLRKKDHSAIAAAILHA